MKTRKTTIYAEADRQGVQWDSFTPLLEMQDRISNPWKYQEEQLRFEEEQRNRQTESPGDYVGMPYHPDSFIQSD